MLIAHVQVFKEYFFQHTKTHKLHFIRFIFELYVNLLIIY